MNEKKRKPIILASSSPRRRELLRGIGLEFDVQPSHVDESIAGETYTPKEIVEELAHRKASYIAERSDAGLVIGSDTIVVLEDRILGKPKDQSEAFDMLTSLQGREHSVWSGLAIIDIDTQQKRMTSQLTHVTMRSLTSEEIRQYIATNEPHDKAGAYAIQGLGATLVERVHGDYFTVVGLPLCLTAQLLKEFGVDVLAN